MVGRSATISACVACALLAFAIGAQGASAAITGTTAFACVEQAGETGQFLREHCIPKAPALGGDEGVGRFEDETITEGAVTNLKITDNNTTHEHTGFVLKTTVAGSAIELVASEVFAIDHVENNVDSESGEHYVHGEGSISLMKVSEKLLGCKVSGESIVTKQLKFSTTGQAMAIRFEPKEGTTLAEFELTGCAIGPVKLKLVGTFKGVPNGATIDFSHNEITEAKTLRINALTGPVAGLTGSFTTTGMLVETKDPTAPVAFRTVETP